MDMEASSKISLLNNLYGKTIQKLRDNSETIFFRLGLESTWLGLNPARTYNNEVRVLDVSSQKEFNKRQSDR